MLKRENRIDSFELKNLKKGVPDSTPLFNAKKYSSYNTKDGLEKNINNNLEEKENNQNKILLITSKKHLKNATRRNLLRRRVYFAFNKLNLNNKKEDGGIDNIKNNTGAAEGGTLGREKVYVLYYMLKDAEQKVPKYSIIEKQINKILNKYVEHNNN